jgi:hypothetical protein
MGSLNVAGLRVRRQRVTTYSGLVKVLRKRIASYVTEGIERVRALREAVRLTDEPVEVEGRIWRDPLQAHLCVHLGHSRGSLDGSLIKGAGLLLRGRASYHPMPIPSSRTKTNIAARTLVSIPSPPS